LGKNGKEISNSGPKSPNKRLIACSGYIQQSRTYSVFSAKAEMSAEYFLPLSFGLEAV